MTQQSDSIKINYTKNKQLIFELTTVVGSDSSIFLSGNFNNWKEKDDRFRFQKISAGKYRLVITDLEIFPQFLEYKYLNGGWDSEELDEYGDTVSNRKVDLSTIGKIEDYVPRWKRKGLYYDPAFLPHPEIISEAFEIPQLIKTRRITALLPYNYSKTTQRYPVLYLQDGQNLFDDYAPFGSWGVNKRLAELAERGMGDLIVIAIDHAEEERIAEFNPTTNATLGSGEGKKYVRFLADTLKPYVDTHFRTIPERTHTGIGGSSMGGLISIYAGLAYPEVYSKLLIFSPSLWVEPNIHFHAIHFQEHLDTKIYLYGGEEESKNMIPNIKRFKKAMEAQNFEADIQFKLSIDPLGQHNEVRWGREFPQAVEWLFFDKNSQKNPII